MQFQATTDLYLWEYLFLALIIKPPDSEPCRTVLNIEQVQDTLLIIDHFSKLYIDFKFPDTYILSMCS